VRAIMKETFYRFATRLFFIALFGAILIGVRHL
jgi:hypothetical protein